MADLAVIGGKRLLGEIKVQGSKNGVLPLISASYLCDGPVKITNCPHLSDIDSCIEILTSLGCQAALENGVMCIKPASEPGYSIDDALMRRMRSSSIFLGAMLAKTGRAEITYPGGCVLGCRPLDIHLYGLRELGAVVSDSGGKIVCVAEKPLKGAKISFSFPSVGATQNIMIAASTAHGHTTIINAAQEPEVEKLVEFLNACGAKINMRGSVITIDGVARLNGCEFENMPDRIATATYMAATAICGGEIFMRGAIASNMDSVLSAFETCGGRIFSGKDGIYFRFKKPPKPIPTLRTMPYPGFPTDAQPLMGAVLAYATGTSTIIETIFENRFKYADELNRMGANVRVYDRTAVIEGKRSLQGAEVAASDLRAGAALVVAALGAEGKSVIHNTEYIGRGYEDIQRDFTTIGGRIWKEYIED